MIAFIILIGAMSGVFTAAGLFALITSVGVINRYADVSGTSRHVFLYEECIIIGATAANAVYVLGITVRIGMTGCIIFGLISGIFIGTFLISLAETVKALPIFVHRAKAGTGLGFIVAATAAGKALGQLVLLIYVLILHCKKGGFMHDINSESGTKADIEKRNESYNAYVKNVTPKGSCVAKCFKAFIVGGCICVAGQIILNVCKGMKVPDTDAASYTTLILVFLSVILTGLNIYPSITTFGGAGSLVPITGFANSVAAPAIEYKKEGRVFGIGCKIFTIAGPVILYGIFFSWCAGLIYLALKLIHVL